MASREVFTDTSALYALVDKCDATHTAAREVVERVVRGGRRLVTMDYVLAETVNLANARGGPAIGRRVLDLLEQSAGLRLELIGTARFDLTKAYYRKYADQRYSFTDCSSFVVMRELKVGDALTTDRHFQQAGFRNLLSA